MTSYNLGSEDEFPYRKLDSNGMQKKRKKEGWWDLMILLMTIHHVNYWNKWALLPNGWGQTWNWSWIQITLHPSISWNDSLYFVQITLFLLSSEEGGFPSCVFLLRFRFEPFNYQDIFVIFQLQESAQKWREELQLWKIFTPIRSHSRKGASFQIGATLTNK